MGAEGDINPEDMDDLGDLDNPDDGDEDDLDDGDEDAGKEGDDKEWKPPTKAQWERAQRRLKTYAAEKRKGGAEVDRKLAAQIRGKDDKEGDDDGAAAEEAQRWRRAAAQQSAAASLTAAGFNGTARQAARLTRLLDLDGAEPDRDGVFDWEDDVEELKEEYPELFGARGSRRNEGAGRLPKVRTAPTRDSATPDDPTQRTSDALLRAAGFNTRSRRRTG